MPAHLSHRRRTAALRSAGRFVAEPFEPRRLLAGVAVTTTDDLSDGDTSSISALLASPGPTGISIREAIAASNNTPGTDVVNFNIPGAGPHTLQLGSALPFITDTLTINGYTQPGAQANSLAIGDNAVIKIQLSGVSGVGVGLNILAPNCVVQGLSMTAFNNPSTDVSVAILVQSPGVVIEGNWLGVRPDGTASGNRGGIGGTAAATGARIGGTTPAARNVISGSQVSGIGFSGSKCVIQGNYIGTNVSGAAAIPNGVGIVLAGADSTVGGAGIGARNVVSGNIGFGVDVRGVSHQIDGNFIGPGASGEPLGNGGGGVRLSGPLVSNGVIRVGSEKDAFNAPVVAYNTGNGINLAQGKAAIGQVSVHNNTGAGVILPTTGPAMVLTSAVSTTTSTTVDGSLTGLTPGRNYVVRFYGNTADGEYEAFVQSFGLIADPSGNAQLINLPLNACGLSTISAIVTELGDAGEADFTVARAEAVVNTTPPVIRITSAAGSGAGSMLAAFTAANLTPGPEVILLDIPGPGFFDVSPTSSITPFLGRINDVLFEGRGQGFGSVVPQTYVNVNNGLGTFNGGQNNTVAGVGFFNVSGRAWDAENGNNTLIHSTVGIGAAEQPLGVTSIVQSDVVRILGGTNNRVLSSVIHAGRDNACVAVYGGTNHLVQGNRIGITPTGVVLAGTTALNNRVGVVINDGTNTDAIDNTIAGMVNDAIKVGEFGFAGGTGHTFVGNQMFVNQQLGIDLRDNGVTANDPLDADTGPNTLLNFPLISSVEQVSGGWRVIGVQNTAANTPITLYFYASSGFPSINTNEGGRLVGSAQVVTDGTGTAPFDITFATRFDEPAFGEVILATAVDSAGNNSEFSAPQTFADTVAPTVSDARFDFEFEQAVIFTTSEGPIAGVGVEDVDVVSLPPGFALGIEAAHDQPEELDARYLLGPLNFRPASEGGGGAIPDGNYRATLRAGAIQDAAGNLLASDRVLDFFILAGDANRDRRVDIDDFGILASRFNQPGVFSQGDFNYSGTTDIDDFAILAGKFNTTLAPAAGVSPRGALPSPTVAEQPKRLIPSLIDDLSL